MDKEYLDLLAEKFAKASAWRAKPEDVDWKEIRYNGASGSRSVKLAYLNWAVAWRAMLEIYPDANFRIIEDALGNPVWNVNGFGFVKCAVSALGVERVETFPIMDNRNDSMPMDKIDPSSAVSPNAWLGSESACISTRENSKPPRERSLRKRKPKSRTHTPPTQAMRLDLLPILTGKQPTSK